MIRQYSIRQRLVEVSTQRSLEAAVDAILLPWRPLVGDEEPSGILGQAGEQVLVEIEDYQDDREVMLTSAGNLPARFFFHLGMPDSGKVSTDLLEERFRDCLFQSSVLGLSDLAVPINEFAPFAESFSDLVRAVWMACREFLNRERGPQRVVFLVEERDLSGQYLRHFFQRKEAEERNWDEMERISRARVSVPGAALPSSEAEPSPSPSPAAKRRQLGGERVLSLDLPAEAEAARALDRLLKNYRTGEDLDAALECIAPLMQQALTAALDEGERWDALPSKLRILGSDLVMRLPFELLQSEGRYLAEEHRFTRGTNFLHFRTDRGARRDDTFRLCFRVLGRSDRARGLAEELRTLGETRKLGLKWSTEDSASTRLVHCLDRSSAEDLLREVPLSCELAFLEMGGSEPVRGEEASAEALALQLLTHGCRRVLTPLAPFRSEAERQAFRSTFYEGLLGGASAGEALQEAQRLLAESFGIDSGWWLYRIFGQTDEVLVPSRGAVSRGNNLRIQA